MPDAMRQEWLFDNFLWCLIPVLLLSGLAVPTSARAEIYNGAPLLNAPYLLPHRSVKMRELWPPAPDPVPDFGVIDEAYVRAFVAALPNDRTYEFDLEGVPEVRADNLHLWWYDANRSTAITLRQDMMYIISNERPDLDVGIWGIPDHKGVRDVIRQPTTAWRARSLGMRQYDYRGVMAFVDTAYVDAYWSWGPTDFEMMDEWKALVRTKVALAQAFFRKLPAVYVWHRGYDIEAPATVHPDIFAEMLAFLSHHCVDIVFWAEQRDDDFPVWVQQQLFAESSKPPCPDYAR
jgi:hypothetical protein